MAEDSSDRDEGQNNWPPEYLPAAIGLARHFVFVATGGLIASALLIGRIDSNQEGRAVPAFAMVAFAVAVACALLAHGYAVQFGQVGPRSPHGSPSVNLKWSWVALLAGLALLSFSALIAVG